MWYSVLKEVAKLKIHVMCYKKCWFTKNCLYEILGTFVVFGTSVLSIFNYQKKKDLCLKLQVSQGIRIIKSEVCQCNSDFLVSSQF